MNKICLNLNLFICDLKDTAAAAGQLIGYCILTDRYLKNEKINKYPRAKPRLSIAPKAQPLRDYSIIYGRFPCCARCAGLA